MQPINTQPNNAPNNILGVFCIDPGVTTGWALGVIYLDEGLMKVSTGQEKWSCLQLWNTLHTIDPSLLIYESFQFRNKHRDGLVLTSKELIGVIKLYHQLHQPFCTLYEQSPATAIGAYYTDSKLKTEHLHKVTVGGHANDACRHLLHWFTFGPGYKYNKAGFTQG